MPTFKFCVCRGSLSALLTLGFLGYACVRRFRRTYLSNTIIPLKSGRGPASWMPRPLNLFSPLFRTCHHKATRCLNKPAFQTMAKGFIVVATEFCVSLRLIHSARRFCKIWKPPLNSRRQNKVPNSQTEILGAKILNLVSQATWRPGFVNPL